MTYNIVQLGHPSLRQPARALDKNEILNQDTQNVIASMKQLMQKAPGVGLAATQIGVPLQIAMIEDKEEYFALMHNHIREERGRHPVPFHVIINPILTILDYTPLYFFEGCLSVCNSMHITPRFKAVKVDCLNEKAEPITIMAQGWYARILQHEIDHLQGKLAIDIAEPNTEISANKENRQKWLNASSQEVLAYLKKYSLK
jgi:peptide deformylase